MDEPPGPAPTIADFERIARAAIASLPAHFANHLEEVVLQVLDFADDEILAAMGIADRYDLTGLYEGIPLPEHSIAHSGTMPPRISLFRLPILAEWAARGNESLEHLITHVTIHEIGHHFGLSDADMHALEAMADPRD